MEDVLEVYKLPHNEKRPVVCLDETNRQLIDEIQTPRPVQPGQIAQYDYEYTRNGVANLFMMFEPLKGRREVMVAERRTGNDFARCLQDLAETQYPDAEKIILVMDNLNTHTPASLYAAFEPETALRLAQRFEIHYTPKHGSWLNMAELEIGVMSRQCLGRRIPSIEKMAGEVQSWVTRRNNNKTAVHWQFTAADARIKLRHLYPKI
jgi:transposase